MGKITIRCMRQAESKHNVSESGAQIRDPLLTFDGMQQCEDICQRNQDSYGTITHLVASPLRRTLQTCLMCFAPIIVRKKEEEVVEIRRWDDKTSHKQKRGYGGKRVIALPELQDISSSPCGTGFPREILEIDFSTTQVDFRFVEDGWCSNQGRWAEEEEAIKARAKWARNWIRSLALRYVAAMTIPIPMANTAATPMHNTPRNSIGSGGANDVACDVEIVIVSHGTFLHFLTEDRRHQRREYVKDWNTAEIRTFEFESLEDENATLKETKDSIQVRMRREQLHNMKIEIDKQEIIQEEEQRKEQRQKKGG